MNNNSTPNIDMKKFKFKGFERNEGQFEEKINFILKGSGYSLYFLKDSIIIERIFCIDERDYHNILRKHEVVNLKKEYLKISFLNYNKESLLLGTELQQGKINYLFNNEKIININSFFKIIYKNIYQKIDLKFYIKEDKLEYDFIVNPGGKVEDIKILIDTDVELDEEGNAILMMENGNIKITKPNSYELYGESEKVIKSEFKLKDNILSVKSEKYDKSKILIVDPILLFSTYLGGTYFDEANGIAVDNQGNSYITGYTTINNFPATNKIGVSVENNYSTFVTKFNSDGVLVYSTIVSGSGQDIAMGIAIDEEGNAYIVGYSSSIDFPTTKVIGEAANGLVATIVYKLNPEGDGLIYSVLLHGNGTELGYAIARDADNNAYITGYTTSSNFPTTGVFGVEYNGTPGIILVKINSTGSDYIYSFFINGDGNGIGFSITVDTDNSPYICGYTNVTDLPFTAKLGSDFEGSYTMIVGKLNSSGSEFVYITSIGGSDNDAANGITVDSMGNAIIVGNSLSVDFPITNTIGLGSNGTSGVIVLKLNSEGTGLIFSTLINGEGTDFGQSIVIDDENNMYITGYTFSQNFPISGIFGVQPNNSIAAFIIKIIPTGGSLYYSIYINGSNLDLGTDIALINKNPYITGYTRSGDFPTLNAYQDYFAGVMDAYVLGIQDDDENVTNLAIYKETTPNIVDINTVLLISIRVINLSAVTAESVVIVDNLSSNFQYISAQISSGTISQDNGIVTGRVAEITGGEEVYITIFVYPLVYGNITNTATVTSSNTDSDPSNNTATVVITVRSIYDILENPTFGLEEIKNEVRTIESTTESNSGSLETIDNLLSNPIYGLNALNEGINENLNETKIIGSNISAINSELNTIKNSINNINNLTTGINNEVSNSTYGLAAIQSELDTIRSLMENIECSGGSQQIINLITNLQIIITNNYNNTTEQNQQLLNIINCNFQNLWDKNCYLEECLKAINEKVNYLIRFKE